MSPRTAVRIRLLIQYLEISKHFRADLHSTPMYWPEFFSEIAANPKTSTLPTGVRRCRFFAWVPTVLAVKKLGEKRGCVLYAPFRRTGGGTCRRDEQYLVRNRFGQGKWDAVRRKTSQSVLSPPTAAVVVLRYSVVCLLVTGLRLLLPA